MENVVQSNLVIMNVLIRNKLALRNHFLWPNANFLHKDKEHFALRNNFSVTKNSLPPCLTVQCILSIHWRFSLYFYIFWDNIFRSKIPVTHLCRSRKYMGNKNFYWHLPTTSEIVLQWHFTTYWYTSLPRNWVQWCNWQ